MAKFIKQNLKIVLLVGLLTLALAAVIELGANDFNPTIKGIVVMFASSVGSTLIAVAIIGSIIEHGIREEQSQAIIEDIGKIKENVFRAVYKRDMPEIIVRNISDNILMAGFTRREYRVSQNIDLIEADNDDKRFVKSFCVVEFFVKNTTANEMEYPVFLEFMQPKDRDLDGEAIFHNARIGDDRYETDVLEKHHRSDDTNKPGFRKYEINTVLAPGQEKSVYLSWTEVRSLDDHIAWFALDLSHDFTINLNVNPSDKIPSHQFDIYPLHPFAGEPMETVNGTMHARIDTVVLPYQGFIVWWKFRDLPVWQHKDTGSLKG